MLDRRARVLYAPAVDRAADRAVHAGITAGAVTGVGLLVGVGACVAAATGTWVTALILWLLNRTLDGLDGAIARRTNASDLGGMFDFLADFVVYGGFLVGVAITQPDARVACAALLAAYLLNNVALLSFASLIEKRRLALAPGCSRRWCSSPSASEWRSPCAPWTDDCHGSAYARMSASRNPCEV